MVCCKCGKNVPYGAIFCCWCGEKTARKVCVACGTALRDDQLFCHECGVKWNGETPCSEEQPVELPIAEAVSGQQMSFGKMGQETDKCAYTLTVFRKWQAGSDDLGFKVYVDDVELGNIRAGESLSVDISSDKVHVEIKYTSSFIMPIRWHMLLKVVEQNPKISFELQCYAGIAYNYLPDISVAVSGAEILKQEN